MSLITQQGKQYLLDRKKTYRIIQPELNLIENFESKEVENINKLEHEQLEYMQQNYKLLLKKWEKQYKKVINYVKEPNLKKCIAKCLRHENIDKRSACLYGCNIGKFANSSVDQRITADKPPDVIKKRYDDTMGASLGLLFFVAMHNRDEDIAKDRLSSTVHPRPGSVIIENFETDAAKGIDVADGLTSDGQSYTTRKWAGANAPQTIANGENYNEVIQTGHNLCNADYGSQNAPPGVKLQACPYKGQICRGLELDQSYTFFGDKIWNGWGNCYSAKPMGSYGPDGKSEVGKKKTGDMINSYLSSDPEYDTSQYYYDTNTEQWGEDGQGGYVVKDGVDDEASANLINPNGIQAIKYTALADLAIKTTQKFKDQPIVKQMELSNVDQKQFDIYLNKMRSEWRNMFISSCKAGIGGFGKTGVNNSIDTKEFAGYTQHCKSWVNTNENRSGYYSNKGVDSIGNTIPLKASTIELKNVSSSEMDSRPMSGCDTPIPGVRASDDVVGGSGYCICADGSLKGYADSGHQAFTCNQVCSPENQGMPSLLYHDSTAWSAPPGFSYRKWAPGNIRADTKSKVLSNNQAYAVNNNTTGRFCGTFDVDYMIEGKSGKAYDVVWGSEYVKNYNAVNNPPACPTGMVKDGEVGLSPYCNSEKQIDEDQFMGIRTGKLTKRGGAPPEEALADLAAKMKDGTSVPGYERRCKYDPVGYTTKPVNHIDKLKKMPLKNELLNACSTSKYEDLYLDILELNLLGFLADTKAAIIYKAIKETYSGSNATNLKKTELGRQIFKNMAIYEKAYNKLRKRKNIQGLTSALLEDVGLKKGSNDISYYIWLTMAAGAAALALTKYNS